MVSQLNDIKIDFPGIVVNKLINVFFRVMPRGFHCIVISLYLFEWKCKVRYFWRKQFTEYLIHNALIYNYKNLRKLMLLQLKWIKIWMFADLIQTLVWIWWSLSHIKTLIESDEMTETISLLIYYVSGTLLTWIMAAGVTQESESFFAFGVKYMEILANKKLNIRKSLYIDSDDKDAFFYETILNEQTLRNDSSKLIKKIDNKSTVKKRADSIQMDIDNKQVLHRKYIENKTNLGHKNEYEITRIQISNRMNICDKIQTVQSFLLFYTEKPIIFKMFGIKISYTTLINMFIIYISVWLFYYYTLELHFTLEPNEE